jgi:hypothetical protein
MVRFPIAVPRARTLIDLRSTGAVLGSRLLRVDVPKDGESISNYRPVRRDLSTAALGLHELARPAAFVGVPR